MSCQPLQKEWYKFILEVDQLALRLMSLLLLLLSNILVKLMEFLSTSSLLLDSIIVTLETLLELYLSVQLMPIQTVFQLSHGQKLNSHNSNILLPNSNMKTPQKRRDVLIMLEESLRPRNKAEELLELSLLSQFHLLEIKLLPQISSRDLEFCVRKKEFHSLLMKLKLV